MISDFGGKELTNSRMTRFNGYATFTCPPTATAVTVARNVARRGVFSNFCHCVQVLLSLASVKAAVTEARRRATVCHGLCYVSSRPATFCWYLSRFVTL